MTGVPGRQLEKDIQRGILEWLAVHRIFHYRNNSGGFRDSNDHFYRFGASGSPDIIAIVNGRFVGIEVKTPTGRQSEAQKAFETRVRQAGGAYILARSIDDVEGAISQLIT